MSKEELYNSIHSKDVISGQEMDDHLSGKRKLDSSNMDEFEKDAFEGWNSSGLTTTRSNRLDKKFGRKSNTGYWLLGIMVIIGVSIFLYTNKDNEYIKVQEKIAATNTEKKFVEETDLYIAEKFDTLIEKTQSNKVEIQHLQNQHEKQPLIQNETKQDAVFEIDNLPILEIENTQPEIKVEISNRKKIKEIYLSDFKLVDYRVLRSQPKIETKQLDLTGTSANQENESSNEDEPVWRKVDIPYYDFIEKSMYVLNKGSLKKALARFDVILNTYPDDINALFYSGFSYYNLGEYNKALSFFKNTLESDIANFDEEAFWYIGLTYEKLGQIKQAKDIFESISLSKSYYAQEAKKRL